MPYSIEGHALLPAGLSGQRLKEEQAVAERVLGLRGAGIEEFSTAEDIADVRRALALQVGVQYSSDPERYITESVGRAGETVDYRTDEATGEAVLVHPLARQIVEQLFSEAVVEEEVEAPSYPIFGPWR